jgi:hypothetical protein
MASGIKAFVEQLELLHFARENNLTLVEPAAGSAEYPGAHYSMCTMCETNASDDGRPIS